MTPKDYVAMFHPKAECRKLQSGAFGVFLDGLDGQPLYNPDLSRRPPDCVGASARSAWKAAAGATKKAIMPGKDRHATE